MKILIKYPTRQRPQLFMSTLQRYYDLMLGTDFQVVVSLDGDDESMQTPDVYSFIGSKPNLMCNIGNSKTKIEAINADIPTTDWDILILASDDMVPQVKGWDNTIRFHMLKYYDNLDGVLHYNDGIRGSELNTLTIMGRKVYDRFGYIYHPSYHSMWCDNEFTDVTKDQTKYIDEVVIRHEWLVNNNDKLMERNLNREWWDADKQNYLTRKEAGFPC